MISGFHRKVDDNCALLGYYSLRNDPEERSYQAAITSRAKKKRSFLVR
jgi:hypothetical protein